MLSRDLQDPRLGFVTVTHVDVAPDLRNATVWISTIGQPDERRDTLRALVHAMPYVRRELRVLRLRRIPELHVKLDESVQRGTRVLQILHELEEGGSPPDPEVRETLPTPRVGRPVDEDDDGEAAVDGAAAVDGGPAPDEQAGGR